MQEEKENTCMCSFPTGRPAGYASQDHQAEEGELLRELRRPQLHRRRSPRLPKRGWSFFFAQWRVRGRLTTKLLAADAGFRTF